MISNQSVQDFKAICEGIFQRAGKAVEERIAIAKSEAARSGTLMSTRTLLAIDRGASEAVTEFAPEVFEALQRLNAAEPIANADARRTQLRTLLEGQLRLLGNRVQGHRDGQSRVYKQGLQTQYKPEQTEAAVARAVTEYLGRIGLAITQHANAPAPAQPVIHQPVFHGHGVNYQPGNGNTGTVNQSVVTQVSPDEVKAALDALIQALQHAQGVTPDQRAEVVDVLEQVKVEADKDKPNKLKLNGLIGSVRDVLEGLGAAPEALETLKSWYAFVASQAVQAAPLIGQALQNFSN